MNLKDWFSKAQTESFAIGAFNVDNLDIFKAICAAAQKKRSPVMVEFSPGEVGYFGLENIVDLVANARDQYKIPIFVNLDHARTPEACLEAIEASVSHSRSVPGSSKAHSGSESRENGGGFDQVHFDGSELELSANIIDCKKVVEAAHAKGILVEGEIDRVSGTSEVHDEEINLTALKNSYTDPVKAAKFVQGTTVDIFAAIFGNVHGTFQIQPDLDFELLSKIREVLPATFLSLHGGSGIAKDQVKEAIKVGRIVKINVNTELRVAFRDALSEELQEVPSEVTYYKLAPDVTEAVMAVVEGKIDVFGSAGRV